VIKEQFNQILFLAIAMNSHVMKIWFGSVYVLRDKAIEIEIAVEVFIKIRGSFFV
jgi:hypothetical protein